MKHNALKYAAQKLNSSESERLHSLKEYDFSDALTDESFDILTEMALNFTQCEVAAISFVGEDELFFKNLRGLIATSFTRGNLPCEIAITKGEIYEVQDLSKHPTLKQRLITKGGKPLKYYAGAPLINKDGFYLGTICVFDSRPKKLTAEKLNTLKLLARKVMLTLELKRKERLAKEALEIRSEKLIKGHMELLQQSKKLEKAKAGISTKEQLLRGILDNSPHLISLTDSRGYYVMVNKAVADLLKLPAEDIVGKHASEMHNDAERIRKNKEVIDQVMETGETSPPFEEVLIINGVKNYYQVVIIPVENTGGGRMILRIATNVTELKGLEVNLHRKNEELESLIYSLSHDLRGPISSILGLLNVEKYASLSDMRQYFSMIKEQTLRMDKSIHDLVELKNITNKTVKPVQVDMLSLINKIVYEFKDAKPEIEFNHPEVLMVNTDEYFVEITLKRVLTNAMEYHHKDAQAPGVEITATSGKGGVAVLIRDNGLGISRKALPRVFEMFYRGTSLSTGHGLGLYIAQNALARVKGKISLNSVEGLGTEVELLIPNVNGKTYID